MKSLNINVMLGLLAVLFISLGYLSMQGKQGFRGSREGFKEGIEYLPQAVNNNKGIKQDKPAEKILRKK